MSSPLSPVRSALRWGKTLALILAVARLAAAGEPSSPAPELELTVAILLYAPPTGAPTLPESLRAASDLRSFTVQLADGAPPPATDKKKRKKKEVVSETHRPVRTLVVARRRLIVQPGATASFDAMEQRPAFVTASVKTPESQPCGLQLLITAGPSSVTPSDSSPAGSGVLMNWKGNFAWSEEILVKWEKYAYALYAAVKAVPGVTYTSQSEDEDGFISGGGGGTINLGGLFRKKKPPQPEPGAAAAETPPSSEEPSFLATPLRNQVVLQGGAVLRDSELLILAFPATAEDQSPRVLYFLLQSRLRA